MNNMEIKIVLEVDNGRAMMQVLYNNTLITEKQARELKEEVLKVTYKKLDEFQNKK